MPPADRADAGNETDPVGGKDEDEDGGKEPERPLDQMPADDALEEAVEAFHQPFQKVLGAAGNLGHASRRHLGEHDETHGDDPRHDHGIRDRKAEGPGDLDGVLRQAVFHRLQRNRDRQCRSRSPRCMRSAARRVPPRRSAHAPVVTPALNRQSARQLHAVDAPPAFRMFSAMSESQRQAPARRTVAEFGRSRARCCGRSSPEAADAGGLSTRARHRLLAGTRSATGASRTLRLTVCSTRRAGPCRLRSTRQAGSQGKGRIQRTNR